MVVQNRILVELARTEDGIARLSVKGAIDHSNSKEFEDSLKSSKIKGAKLVIIDCSHLDYMNSAGFSILLNMASAGRKNELKVGLINLNKRIKDIVSILGLDKVFIIASSEEDLLQQVK